jgi:hypothetical protein
VAVIDAVRNWMLLHAVGPTRHGLTPVTDPFGRGSAQPVAAHRPSWDGRGATGRRMRGVLVVVDEDPRERFGVQPFDVQPRRRPLEACLYAAGVTGSVRVKACSDLA